MQIWFQISDKSIKPSGCSKQFYLLELSISYCISPIMICGTYIKKCMGMCHSHDDNSSGQSALPSLPIYHQLHRSNMPPLSIFTQILNYTYKFATLFQELVTNWFYSINPTHVLCDLRSIQTTLQLCLMPIYWLFSPASHCSITSFHVKMIISFNVVTSKFLCSREHCSNAMQMQCSMNWSLLSALRWMVY